MPQRDDKPRKRSSRQRNPRFFREIPWLTIICPSDFNLDSAVSCWLVSRFLRDPGQRHSIRTSKAEGLVSVFENPYWTQVVIGLSNSQFNSKDDKLASEIVLEELTKLENQDHFNGGILVEIVTLAKDNEVLEKILRGTHINIGRVEESEEISAQKTLIKFGYILDAIYQALAESEEK